MQFEMRFDEYAGHLAESMNAAVRLDTLLAPFALTSPLPNPTSSPDLLVGHLMDDLYAEIGPQGMVDPMTVAACAWELGFDEAGAFLDCAPYLIYQLIKSTTSR